MDIFHFTWSKENPIQWIGSVVSIRRRSARIEEKYSTYRTHHSHLDLLLFGKNRRYPTLKFRYHVIIPRFFFVVNEAKKWYTAIV